MFYREMTAKLYKATTGHKPRFCKVPRITYALVILTKPAERMTNKNCVKAIQPADTEGFKLYYSLLVTLASCVHKLQLTSVSYGEWDYTAQQTWQIICLWNHRACHLSMATMLHICNFPNITSLYKTLFTWQWVNTLLNSFPYYSYCCGPELQFVLKTHCCVCKCYAIIYLTIPKYSSTR